jgi:hypothetical protein
MDIRYNIYKNDHYGGDIDYSTPIFTTSDLSFTTPSLPLSSNNLYAVRAFDAEVGVEESNTDAFVRIIIDSTGNDVTLQPNPPDALFVRALASGTCRATWAYSPNGQGGFPTEFLVYLTAGSVPSYTVPITSVPYRANVLYYACSLGGLADDIAYTVAVRASNLTATETNTSVIAPVVGNWASPSNVDDLAATPTH